MPLIPEWILHDASPEQISRLQGLARRAELTLDMKGTSGTVLTGAALAHAPLISVTPLQDGTGALRPDVTEVLHESGAGLVSEERAAEILANADRLISRTRGEVLLVTTVQQLAFELLRSTDPAVELEKYIAANEAVRFYKVEASDAFHTRDTLWRILTSMIENVTGIGMLDGAASLPPSTAPLGLSSFPAELLTVPLATRLQPLALGATTRRGAHVVGVYMGTGAVRNPYISTWPVAQSGLVFGGTGEGTYSSRFSKIPADWPLGMLNALASGANLLAEITSNPDLWTDDAGQLDIVERNIFVASIKLGLSALAEAASEWGSPGTLWAAYRALGILMGLWRDKGNDEVPLKLRQLLDPGLICGVAVPRLQPESYRHWVVDVVNHYEREISATMFPSLSLADGLERLEDTRNLVHGAGAARKNSRRSDRMKALAGARKGAPIIPDIANIWWTAAIMDPRGMSLGGPAPFPGHQ